MAQVVKKPVEQQKKKDVKWGVLTDDYMMTPKMSDWKDNEESESGDFVEQELEQEFAGGVDSEEEEESF
jgi:hypothetical protein